MCGTRERRARPCTRRALAQRACSAGCGPRGVLQWPDGVAAAGLELHSFMVYRNGHVVAEGWCWPSTGEPLGDALEPRLVAPLGIRELA
jgi:hypothetical protein